MTRIMIINNFISISSISQLHDSPDLVAGDNGDPGGVVDPGDGGGVQGHADVPATYVVHAGAQQEAPHRFHLRRYQPDDVDVHHRRVDVSHHGTSLPGSDCARATASTDDVGAGTASAAGEVDSDHLEVEPGPLCPYVPRGRPK